MKKRILSLLLALVMLLGLLPTVALASGGAPTTKTAEDGKTYYLIEDEADLKWFRDQVNGGKGTINAKLTADITLTEANWTPIGKAADYSAGVYEANAFKGIFDGNRKTISGLKIDCTASSSVALGLFGVANGATIKNLVVRGEIKATLNKTSSATFEIGGVVGQRSSWKYPLQMDEQIITQLSFITRLWRITCAESACIIWIGLVPMPFP